MIGNEYSLLIPIIPEETEYEAATLEFNETMRHFSKGWIISDEFFQLITKVLQKAQVVSFYPKNKNNQPSQTKWYAFRLLNDEESSFWSNVNVHVNDEHVFSVDVDTVFEALNVDDFRYNNVMLLITEVSKGFVSYREHSIVNRQWELKQEQKYKIGQDIDIIMDGETIESVEAVPTQYTTIKTENGWSVMWPDLKTPILTDDFVPIITKKLNDNRLHIRLLGAYTHILRKVLWYNPQTWQFRYLMSERRLNIVAWTRRAGKTMKSSYKILRRLYRNPSNRKHAYRQVKMMYLAPSEEKFKSVLDFIEASSEKIRMLKVLKYRKDTKRLELIDETLWRNNKPVINVVATCDFVSDKSYEPWRGNGSDEIIIDEAWFIREETYLNLLPIIENEQSEVFAISTIDWETPKHWFYELLTEYEQWGDIDGYAQRVTIDDIDDHIIPKTSKERMKKALSKNMDRYYAELYATFPSSWAVFETSKFFVAPRENDRDKLTHIVIGYDPAKRSDFSWIAVGYVCKRTVNGNEENILQFREEYQIQGDYVPYQRDFLLNLKASLKDRYNVPVKVIIDATVVGDVVADAFGAIVDYRIWYTWSSSKPEMDKWGCWKFSKKNLVHMTQLLMETRKVSAWSTLKNLIMEIKNFKMYHSGWSVKYDATTGHDDVVNAMMVANFVFWFLDGNIHSVGTDSDAEWRTKWNENLQKDSNLYNGFQKRWAYVKEEIQYCF